MGEPRTFKHKLIYAYTIPYDDHKGLMKIGEHDFYYPQIDNKGIEVYPDSDGLRKNAEERIKAQTTTAGIQYNLEYAENASYIYNSEYRMLRDRHVHEVLKNSGYLPHAFQNVNGKPDEWYEVNLELVKKAIKAAKEEYLSLALDDHKKRQSANNVIKFREEQTRAINQTLNVFKTRKEMLWNAKMRFGKTLCALEVVRQLESAKRVIIISHRPDVKEEWFGEFEKLPFPNTFKHGAKGKGKDSSKEFEAMEELASRSDARYLYFASIQDLRGSFKKVTGGYDIQDLTKNAEIFNTKWDLLIVDEAHEGTTTTLGNMTIRTLQKKNPKIRTLYLSGTPFNIQDKFKKEQIFTWDYNMEQKAKNTWDELHPGEPNDYENLPRMEYRTYDIGDVFKNYRPKEDNDFFNFSEFFRTESVVVDGKAKPKFVHEDDVKQFLVMLRTPDEGSFYPFATLDRRLYLQHSLWLFDHVDSAHALKELIEADDILKEYAVVDVAGTTDADEHEDDPSKAYEKERKAKAKVDAAIAANEKTITLSCGRLTTGTTVREWTAVFMLNGGSHANASGYLQAAFRCQSPSKTGVLPRKVCCYVYDFAPDRTIEVVHKWAENIVRSECGGKRNRDFDNKLREKLREMLNLMPVISYKGGRENLYEMETLLSQLNKIHTERIRRKKFATQELFISYENMSDRLIDQILRLQSKMKAKNTSSDGDNPTGQTTSKTGLDNAGNGSNSNTNTANGAKEKTKKDAEKTKKENVYGALYEFSKRIPLIIYGLDIKDENITIDTLIKIFKKDKTSWDIFMPKNVSLDEFIAIKEVWQDNKLLTSAKDVRDEVREAEKLPIQDRVKEIARIIGTFRYVSNETVLTPWRVVNMHMTDTLGGYSFFKDPKKISDELLEEPILINRGKVTTNVFFDDKTKILEINSKSGIYPLWLAFNLWKLLRSKTSSSKEDEELWKRVIENNLFIVCESLMAKLITLRTLRGFNQSIKPNILVITDIVERSKKGKMDELVAEIQDAKKYGKKGKRIMLKFSAVVSNPPYQKGEIPVYHHFVKLTNDNT